ncbi:MAG: hypothetical protein IJT57_02435 [Selenomonadaceae bacterium]|nr:hypothetical protein [Selenomonadaceae bacterium]MBQ7723157.1 hypothetical protein [Selenomonadaceae bacterium]
MSEVNYSNGRFFLTDGQKSLMILDVRTPYVNRSRVHSHQLAEEGGYVFPLDDTVNAAIKKIFKKTTESLAEVLIYARIVAHLLRKPQIHNVLKIGQWSPLDEALAEILPQFNPSNKLYCLSEMRPVGKIPSVTFLLAEGGEYPLPENKFDTIIFPKHPPLEILLAVKDYGKIYFTATKLEESLKSHVNILPLTKQSALIELEISPQLRQKIRRRTPQGQLDERISEIKQLVEKLPAVLKKKNSRLDEYIAEVVRAEKVLAEIFPMLYSETIKFNFNVLKEFLIDLRLGNGSVARVNRQYEILLKDLSNG